MFVQYAEVDRKQRSQRKIRTKKMLTLSKTREWVSNDTNNANRTIIKINFNS